MKGKTEADTVISCKKSWLQWAVGTSICLLTVDRTVRRDGLSGSCFQWTAENKLMFTLWAEAVAEISCRTADSSEQLKTIVILNTYLLAVGRGCL